MRIMGLDFGTVRIGVAISDELLLTAQGQETIRRSELQKDLAKINELVSSNGVVEIIVGLPISMNGTHSAKTKEAIEFIEVLTKAVTVPVKAWDERLTSVQAERAMLEADISRAKRRKASDRLASQFILQSYLDSRKRTV